MGQAERVPDLVGGQLANTRQGELDGIVRGPGTGLRRAGQSLEEQPILTQSQRPQAHVTFEHLARAGIGDTTAIRPAARRAMDPLHDVVAHIHRVGIFRQHLDVEGVLEACPCEGFGPPAHAVDDGAANRLGYRWIDVVDQRLDRGRRGGGRILFFQPVADDPTAFDAVVQRCRVVGELNLE